MPIGAFLRQNEALAIRQSLGASSRSLAHMEPKTIDLKPNYEADLQFRWHMCFNRFKVEKLDNGKIVNFAYVVDHADPRELVRVFISNEGLFQMRKSVESYLPSLSGVGDPGEKIEEFGVPERRFSPLFTNHIRLARSGDTAEIACYMAMLTFLADEIVGRRKKGSSMPLVPVALLHSTVPIHYRFICSVLDGVKE
jgi:hypothetical protein